MKAQGSHKQVKQAGKARIRQPLGVARKNWKQELRGRNSARRQKKKQEEKKVMEEENELRPAKQFEELAKHYRKKIEENEALKTALKKNKAIDLRVRTELITELEVETAVCKHSLARVEGYLKGDPSFGGSDGKTGLK